MIRRFATAATGFVGLAAFVLLILRLVDDGGDNRREPDGGAGPAVAMSLENATEPASTDGWSVGGVVESGYSCGLSDCTVRLTELGGELVAELRADEEGTFLFSEVEAGEYELKVASPSWGTLSQRVRVPTSTPSIFRFRCESAARLTIIAPADDLENSLTLRLVSRVKCGEQGEQLTRWLGVRGAASSGEMLIGDLGPGQYTLRGVCRTMPLYETFTIEKNGQEVPVVLEPNASPVPRFFGRALLEVDDSVLRNTYLKVDLAYEGAMGHASAETDSEGFFFFSSNRLVPGTQLRFWRGREFPFVEIEYQGPKAISDIVFSEARDRIGRVVDRHGRPLAYMRFALVSSDVPGLAYHKRSDQDGSFLAGDIVPGTYYCTGSFGSTHLRSNMVSVVDRVIEFAESADNVTVECNLDECLSVRVKEDLGKDVGAYFLGITVEQGESKSIRRIWQRKIMKMHEAEWKDRSGTIVCDLPPLEAASVVRVEALSFTAGWGSVSISGVSGVGGLEEVVVRLTKPEEIPVRVVDSGGNPVTDAEWKLVGWYDAFGMSGDVADGPVRHRPRVLIGQGKDDGVYTVRATVASGLAMRIYSKALGLGLEVDVPSMVSDGVVVLEAAP